MQTEIDWLRVITVTQAEAKKPTNLEYDDYLKVAHRLFPAEMSERAASFTRQGEIKALKAAMRTVADITEQTDDGPQIRLHLIPGRPVPAFVNVGTLTDPKLLAYLEQTVKIARGVNNKRRVVKSRIDTRIEDEELKIEFFAKHAESEDETYRSILERIEKGKGEAA